MLFRNRNILMHNITLIIPAKNESESLPSVLNELKQYPYKIDIILHSTDSETIRSIKNYDVNIIYQKNFGYGDALIHGINQCKTKYFVIFNADGSFNPLEIDKMYKSLDANKLDFIFASRYDANSGSDDDTLLTLIGIIFLLTLVKYFLD